MVGDQLFKKNGRGFDVPGPFFRYGEEDPVSFWPRPQTDHLAEKRPVKYKMSLPLSTQEKIKPAFLYIHEGKGRQGRDLSDTVEAFVNETRMGNPSDEV